MNENTKKLIRKFVRYMRKTYKNKLVALAIAALGVLSVFIENNITLLVGLSGLALYLFFAKENWIS